MKNGLILSAAVAALAGCASNAPMTTDKSLSIGKPAAQAEKLELKAGQQALPEKQAMAKAGEVKPLLVMQDGVGTAQAAYISGKQALGNGKLEAAQKNFEKARQLDPKMVDALVGLGAVFSLSGRHDRAVIAFEKAVSLEPGNANWHSNLGMAHARNGAFAQAQQSLAKAWSLDPDNSRIEAQLTRVTSVAKANGQATPVAAPVVAKAPEVAASPLQKVGERVFTLKLGGSSPALSDSPESAAVENTDSAPLVSASAETDIKSPAAKSDVAKSDDAVNVPSLPALKIARANLAARASKLEVATDKLEVATDKEAPAVKKDVEPAKLALAPQSSTEAKAEKLPAVAEHVAGKSMAKAAAAAVVVVKESAMPAKQPELQKPVVEKALAPIVKPVAKGPTVSEPAVQKASKVIASPAAKEAAAKKVVTRKVMAKKPAAKKPVVKKSAVKKPTGKKPVMVRSVRGMVIVAANSTMASKVSTHLALNGLRAEKVAKPNAGLVPLTEIHYRTGHEADVAAVTKALPVRAYPIELGGLPAGVNIKVVVGSDMKRAKL